MTLLPPDGLEGRAADMAHCGLIELAFEGDTTKHLRDLKVSNLVARAGERLVEFVHELICSGCFLVVQTTCQTKSSSSIKTGGQHESMRRP
jgi:hypothetical protein